ncbi:MAG: hypothetical protein ACI9W2_004255, partial [Gammaproteobacteria bacterium]
AKPSVQAAGRSAFLRSLDQVSAVGKAEPGPIDDDIIAFALRYTARAVQTVSFSSALTGIWIFGTQTRSVTTDGTLAPLRVVREDVDVGYYSSTYDTVLFRAAAATATGPRRERLLHHLDDLTPTSYRDAKRHDPHNLSFARMTCAQCHQMAGRDAVHVAINDALDRRYLAPVRATEFLVRELDRQLTFGALHWDSASGSDKGTVADGTASCPFASSRQSGGEPRRPIGVNDACTTR